MTVISQAIRLRPTGVFSTSILSKAVTPDLALSYLRALNPSLKAAVVVSAQGEVLAGDATLAAEGGAASSTPADAPSEPTAAHAPSKPTASPPLERVSATRDGCTVIAVAPAGVPAVLARHDCAVAATAVRDRC